MYALKGVTRGNTLARKNKRMSEQRSRWLYQPRLGKADDSSVFLIYTSTLSPLAAYTILDSTRPRKGRFTYPVLGSCNRHSSKREKESESPKERKRKKTRLQKSNSKYLISPNNERKASKASQQQKMWRSPKEPMARKSDDLFLLTCPHISRL